MDGVPDDVGGGRVPPPDGRAWLPTHQMPGVQRPVSRWKDEPKLREEKGREGTGIIPSAWSPGSMSFLPSGVCVLSSEGRWGCGDLPRAATTARTANGERRTISAAGGISGRQWCAQRAQWRRRHEEPARTIVSLLAGEWQSRPLAACSDTTRTKLWGRCLGGLDFRLDPIRRGSKGTAELPSSG